MKHKMLNEGFLNEDVKLTEDDLNPYFRKDAKNQYKDYLSKTAEKRKQRDEVIRDVRELGIETGKSKDYIDDKVDKAKKVFAVPDFKLDKDAALERENYPYYLTVYNKGAVYEPAEGGYYVEVQFPNYSQGYNTYEEAKAELDEFISTDDADWHEVGKDTYEWEGRYVGDGQYVRLETNKNYLKAVVEYNGYESFKGHKFKSKKRPNKLKESKSPDLVWRIRNNSLNYDSEREAHHGSDNKGYHVDIQDRLSNTTEFSGVKDKNGNIVGMGRKLNRQPKTASQTWGRIWKDDKLVKSFEGPKYKVRGQMINYLDKDDLNESFSDYNEFEISNNRLIYPDRDNLYKDLYGSTQYHAFAGPMRKLGVKNGVEYGIVGSNRHKNSRYNDTYGHIGYKIDNGVLYTTRFSPTSIAEASRWVREDIKNPDAWIELGKVKNNGGLTESVFDDGYDSSRDYGYGEDRSVIFDCKQFYRDIYDRIIEGSNADTPNNIKQIFSDLGGKAYVRNLRQDYFEVEGWLPTNGVNVGGSNPNKWTFWKSFRLSDLYHDADFLTEDLTKWYYTCQLKGTKVRHTQDLSYLINNYGKIDWKGLNSTPDLAKSMKESYKHNRRRRSK